MAGRVARFVMGCVLAAAPCLARAQALDPAASSGRPTQVVPAQPATPGEPTAAKKACIERLGDLARSAPIFIEALCGDQNDINQDNTTAAMPPIFPQDGFDGLFQEKRV